MTIDTQKNPADTEALVREASHWISSAPQ